MPAPDPQAAAPGQAKKSEQADAKAKAKAKRSATPAERQPAAKPAKATPTPAQKSEPKSARRSEQPSGSRGRSAEAHHHVIICHRTGSASNPYVVINIPWTAWTEAHSPHTGSHPDLDGRSDIMLKDPASRPGSKDGFTKASCGTPAPPPRAPVDGCPNLEGMQATVPAGMVKDAHGNCVAHAASVKSVTTTTAITVQQLETKSHSAAVKTAESSKAAARVTTETKAPVADVLRESTPAKKAANEQAGSGVLGAVASAPEAVAQTATSGTLPFTGLPLWVLALFGGSLIAAGLAVRRAARR